MVCDVTAKQRPQLVISFLRHSSVTTISWFVMLEQSLLMEKMNVSYNNVCLATEVNYYSRLATPQSAAIQRQLSTIYVYLQMTTFDR